MAAGSRANLTVQTIVDKERSPLQFQMVQIDAANLATWLGQWGTFKTATDAIMAGVLRHEKIAIYDTPLSGALPASNFARRELKLLISYQGVSTGRRWTFELPCPDLAALTLETGDANYVNLADGGVMAAWVTALVAILRAPDDDTEVCTILSARVVGRNI